MRLSFPRLLVGFIPAALAMAADPASGVNHATSPSEIVNAHIPQWVRLSGELRAREEGFFGNHFTEGNDDMYLLQRVRLGVELRPTPWLTGFAQVQDARVSFADRVPAAPPLQDSLDLRQAYVQLGGESHLLNLRVGRQDLALGAYRRTSQNHCRCVWVRRRTRVHRAVAAYRLAVGRNVRRRLPSFSAWDHAFGDSNWPATV